MYPITHVMASKAQGFVLTKDDTKVKMILEMLFLKMRNADMPFCEKIFT